MDLSDLKQKSIKDLAALAADRDIDNAAGMRRQELIFALLQAQADGGGTIHAEGVLEILPDGFGFLRAPDHNYLPGADDIYVSPSQIRRFSLRTGDTVAGIVRPPKESERYFALLRVENVNAGDPEPPHAKVLFDNLTPQYPTERLRLEYPDGPIANRIIDLLCPLGKGQRCLIESPPRAGKTALMLDVLRGLEHNHPECAVLVLLIDERPEEVTELRRNVSGEVISSTFDEPPGHHVQVAEIVIEKAKRMAESGRDVVILLDSITRLARAYNAVLPASGKLLAGVVDPAAMHKPKRLFGAARNLEQGGSLTIIATALVATGSRTDEIILEELAGTGNCEVRLDASLMEQRQFPAIDIPRSGTHKEELLLSEDELARTWALREQLHDLDAAAALELVKRKIEQTATNAELVAALG